jgi:hypothetical protein
LDGITVTPKATGADATLGYVEDNIRPIAGLLGINVHAIPDTDGKALQKIYEHVRGDNKQMTELELLHKVRELENRLGMTNLGERRLDKVYRYVKLQSQIDHLSSQRDRELR